MSVTLTLTDGLSVPAAPPAWRPMTTRELWADGAVHAAGLAFGVGATAVLLSVALSRGGLLLPASLGVYCLGLLAMLSCSAAYNLTGAGNQSWSRRLRRLDHAAIFAMIAGTYTPLMVLTVGGLRGFGLLAVVWTVAAVGMALKLFYPHRIERISIALYLALGWTGIAVLDRLFDTMTPTSLILLAAGGVLYCVGVVFHLWERLPFQTAIWHLFVLAAAICHFAVVLGAALGA